MASGVRRYVLRAMNDPTEPRMKSGAARPSTRSPVACVIRRPRTASDARRTTADHGRSRAGHTVHVSVSGFGGAETLASRASTLGLEIPPRQGQPARRAGLVQTPHRRL